MKWKKPCETGHVCTFSVNARRGQGESWVKVSLIHSSVGEK